MSADPLSIAFPAVGLFMDDSVAPFTAGARSAGISFIDSATNMGIDARRYQTRNRWVEKKLASAPDGWLEANTQGVIPYDPRTGFTKENRTTGQPGMIESAAGRLYRITVHQNEFTVEDISSGVYGRPSMRLAWMCQAASYVIRTDAVSPTQIWDGTFTFTSSGYNFNAPASSRLPNFAGPVAYTDRIWIVNNGNEIIAGDHIHRTNLIGNDDLLRTTDQSYDITSISFPAPADMGDIVSMSIVTSARGGDLPAQAEIVAGTEGPGMWGVISGTPRSRWATTAMRRIVHPNIGPTGPYATWAANDELIFRTVEGLMSIKYVTEEKANVGNPHINIGQEIKPLLDKDPVDLLLFTSLHVSIKQQRLACTVWPVIDGAHRWSRGYVSAALSPGRTKVPEAMVWESVNTLPAAMGEVIQFCEVRSIGRRRIYALLRKADGTKGLAEWTGDWGDDILADGTPVPIPWQLLTRRLSPKDEMSPSNWGDVYLSLLKIRDKVKVQIYARTAVDQPFDQVFGEEFTNTSWLDERGYAEAEPVHLGRIFERFNAAPWLQILVKGEGSAIVDLAISGVASGSPQNPGAGPITCLLGERLCEFDVFNRS
jgi:hypothetical protein